MLVVLCWCWAHYIVCLRTVEGVDQIWPCATGCILAQDQKFLKSTETETSMVFPLLANCFGRASACQSTCKVIASVISYRRSVIVASFSWHIICHDSASACARSLSSSKVWRELSSPSSTYRQNSCFSKLILSTHCFPHFVEKVTEMIIDTFLYPATNWYLYELPYLTLDGRVQCWNIRSLAICLPVVR